MTKRGGDVISFEGFGGWMDVREMSRMNRWIDAKGIYKWMGGFE